MPQRVGLARVIEALFGPRARLILGAILIGACALWMLQNGLFDHDRAVRVALNGLGRTAAQGQPLTQPLRLPLLPESVAGLLLDSYSPAVAGLILIVSLVLRRQARILLFWASALVVLAGHALPLPTLGGVRREWVSMAVGAAMITLGLLLTQQEAPERYRHR